MIRITYLLLLLISNVLLIGCSESDEAAPAPQIAVLTSPEQNQACTSGTILSASESAVTFTWKASANTDGYELHIKNLASGSESSQLTGTNQATITLLRNTPYSWYVVSKSSESTETAKSATWKFYNSGPAVVTHPPFPAEIMSPTFGQEVAAGNNAVTLTWSGSDVDNDIISYDVYFGTTTAPPLFKSSVATTSVASVPVAVGSTYYWRIVSKDGVGNRSESEVFQFKVN